VWVGVTRAEKAGSARQVASVFETGSGRPDQTACECHEGAIPGSISGNEFCRETRTLRESNESNFMPLDSGFNRAPNDLSQKVER